MKILGVSNINPNIQRNQNYSNKCTFCGYNLNPDIFDPSEFEDHGEASILDAYDRNRGFVENPTDWKQLLREAERIGAGNPVTDETLNAMGIHSLKELGNNCYKGGMGTASDNIEGLKAKGINKFIILCDPEVCDIGKKCRESGVTFKNFYIPHSDINIKDNLHQFTSKNSVNDFIDAILSLREGGVLVGCEGGNHRTNRFLSIVRILDPNCKLDLGLLRELDSDLGYAQQIYKRLSEESKAKLGYTKEFEAKLLQKFASLSRYVR